MSLTGDSYNIFSLLLFHSWVILVFNREPNLNHFGREPLLHFGSREFLKDLEPVIEENYFYLNPLYS